MIRNAVIHVINEQPLMADLFGVPSAGDLALVCTNLRTMNGKRPIFADRIESIFVFPYAHIRFVEIPPGADAGSDASTPGGDAAALASGTNGNGHGGGDLLPVAPPLPEPEPEADLEIDEDFLRRIREV
ncbi:MAG TPA: hypothetical protein VGC90_10280 [Candidatus Limnocylindrales bacterium]